MWYQCRNLISSHVLDQYFIQLCCWSHGLVWFSRLMCQNRNMCGIDANNVFSAVCSVMSIRGATLQKVFQKYPEFTFNPFSWHQICKDIEARSLE